MSHSSSSPPVIGGRRYLEAPRPIHFPVEAEVPETKRHLELRTTLYQLLRGALPDATVGSDQFIYLDASDPRQCVAPDVYVRFTPETDWADSWKIWERGSPELAVEVVSEFDRSKRNWERRFQRYRQMGVRELLRLDPDNAENPLQIWDRVEGDLRQRVVDEAFAPSLVCSLYWAVAPVERCPTGLRIATGPSLSQLIPTDQEARIAEQQARQAEQEARQAEQEARQAEQEARQAEQQARQAEQRAREAAEARIAELEAELRRRDSQ